MEIRMAEPKDLEEWLRMRCALYPGDSPEDLGQGAEAVLAEKSRAAAFVAMRDDGRPGGFLEASIHTDYVLGCYSGMVGYIESWYVDPDLRRQKIGAALAAAAEKWAIERGCREMASDCYLENGISLQAHLGIGYQETGRLIHFRKELASTLVASR